MPRFFRTAKIVVRIPKEDFSPIYTNEITIQGLRIAFTIVKSLSWSGNTGIIRIWGLAQGTRNIINKYGCQIEVYAGYELNGGPQVLYIGQAIAISHSYDQPEIVSTFECIDGDKYFNQAKGSVSYAPGTLVRTVLEDLASKVGIQLFPITTEQNIQYKTGFSFTGSYREAIFKAAEFLNLQATIQNGILYVVPLRGSLPGVVYDLNENTGMQGIPERFTYRGMWEYRAISAPPVGYKVSSSLVPIIKPFDLISLTSTHLNIIKQPHRVEAIRHSGDTYGQEWSSNLELTVLPPTNQAVP